MHQLQAVLLFSRFAHHAWIGVFILFALAVSSNESIGQPLFENSVVSHETDLITADDPTVEGLVRFIKIDRREMLDQQRENLFDTKVCVYEMNTQVTPLLNSG